jgi:hypothetical protein
LPIFYLLFLSKNIYWHGDFAWGPRYLLPITPYLVLPIAPLLDSPAWQKTSFLRKTVLSLFAVSVLIQLASVAIDGTRYFISLQMDKKIEFTQVQGVGVQPIREPPAEVYFDWRLSPIAAQFNFFYDTASWLHHYRHAATKPGVPLLEAAGPAPYVHVFDFWWMRLYLAKGNSLAIITAILLSFLAFCSALRAKRLCS